MSLLINMVLETNKTKIMTVMTITNDHLHHMTTFMTNYLAMSVEDHLHTIAPTPKRVVRASQVTATNIITDKEHPSLTERKDTKKTQTQYVVNADQTLKCTRAT
jgi:hypothetical protein